MHRASCSCSQPIKEVKYETTWNYRIHGECGVAFSNKLCVRIESWCTCCRAWRHWHDVLGNRTLHDPYGFGGVRGLHGCIVAGLWVGHARRPDDLCARVTNRRHLVWLGMERLADVHSRDPHAHGVRHLGNPPAVAHRLGTF